MWAGYSFHLHSILGRFSVAQTRKDLVHQEGSQWVSFKQNSSSSVLSMFVQYFCIPSGQSSSSLSPGVFFNFGIAQSCFCNVEFFLNVPFVYRTPDFCPVVVVCHWRVFSKYSYVQWEMVRFKVFWGSVTIDLLLLAANSANCTMSVFFLVSHVNDGELCLTWFGSIMLSSWGYNSQKRCQYLILFFM